MGQKLCGILLLLVLSISAKAQPLAGQALLDSLSAQETTIKSNTPQDDSNAVRLYNRIALEYLHINPSEGIKYAAKELLVAQKMGWRSAEAQAYNVSGVNHLNRADYPQALDDFFKSQVAYDEVHDTLNLGLVAGNIGNVYLAVKDFSKAENYYLKELQIAQWQNERKQMVYSFGNLANTYSSQGKNHEAADFYAKALKEAETIDDKWMLMSATANMGSSYSSLAQYNEALVYHYRSLRLAQSIDDKQTTALAMGNIGESYYLIAKDSSKVQADSLVPASKAENLDRGITYLSQSLQQCRTAQLMDAIPEFAQYLSEAYVLKGDYKAALAAFREYSNAKDSVFNIANNEKIANLETKRVLDLKDKDIKIAQLEVAKKRNERAYFIAGIALLLLVLGVLWRSFKRQQVSNQLISSEKKRSDDLLLNILPSEVAEELKTTGKAHARQFDHVTVLFTDFVNFTGIAENLSPHDLVMELNDCFTAFDAIIEKYGLEKIKTVGDAYIAVCGLPLEDPQHGIKCVQAALEIRTFVQGRIRDYKSFQIRIGINSGPVVAGIVGIKKFAYDIWGDTVNTAARMEHHSEPGRINISQSTYDLVKDHFPCLFRGYVAAKNKGEIAMYFVGSETANILT